MEPKKPGVDRTEQDKKVSDWEKVKQYGPEHYFGTQLASSGETQPIDLFRVGQILRDWAIGEIMQHAYRNRCQLQREIRPQDFEKIKHYADIILADFKDRMEERKVHDR